MQYTNSNIAGTRLFGLTISVWPFRSEPFRSGPIRSGQIRSGRFSHGTFRSDYEILQKSYMFVFYCKHAYVNERFYLKNYKHDPRSNSYQHQRMILIIISKQ